MLLNQKLSHIPNTVSAITVSTCNFDQRNMPPNSRVENSWSAEKKKSKVLTTSHFIASVCPLI